MLSVEALRKHYASLYSDEIREEKGAPTMWDRIKEKLSPAIRERIFISNDNQQQEVLTINEKSFIVQSLQEFVDKATTQIEEWVPSCTERRLSFTCGAWRIKGHPGYIYSTVVLVNWEPANKG